MGEANTDSESVVFITEDGLGNEWQREYNLC